MQFGAFVPQGWRMDLVGIPVAGQWATMAGVARRLEALGYDSIWVYDHFHTIPIPSQEVTYEAWTLMAALATVTERVRLGQMCTCNSYRPPAYLAKVAASIDAISGGRIEMGIGAGWYEHEYLGYGYEYPKASVRIGQLREAVEIMRRLWTEDVVDYRGEYYTLQGAICRPRPVQEPHIPLWIAGGGEKLTLNVAARYGAYTNFSGSVDEFRHKSEVLAGHCRDVGRDFDEIVRSANFNVVIGEDEEAIARRLAWVVDHYSPFVGAERAARLLESTFRSDNGLTGTPDQIVAVLQAWKDVGMAYAILYFPEAAYDPSGQELFAREVIPRLR